MKKEEKEVLNTKRETKNKIMTVLLCISLFCVFSILLLTIFDKSLFGYNTNSNVEQEEKEVTEKQVEEKDIDKDTINSLVDKVDSYGLDALYQEEKDITFDKTSTNGQLYLAYSYNEGQLIKEFGENNTKNVTKEMMDKYFMDVYGYQPTTYKDIICQVEKEVLYAYKEDKKEYVYNENHPGHGYYGPGFLAYHVSNAKMKDNTYTIDVIFLRGNEMEGYEVNGVDVTDKTTSETDYENELIKYFHEHLDEFVNGTKYRYVFEKVEGNFYLRAFSIVK